MNGISLSKGFSLKKKKKVESRNERKGEESHHVNDHKARLLPSSPFNLQSTLTLLK